MSGGGASAWCSQEINIIESVARQGFYLRIYWSGFTQSRSALISEQGRLLLCDPGKPLRGRRKGRCCPRVADTGVVNTGSEGDPRCIAAAYFQMVSFSRLRIEFEGHTVKMWIP